MSALTFSVRIEGDFGLWCARQARAAERAVQSGVAGTVAAVKANWRDQIRSAGLGGRLAGSIRSDVYPKGQPSINAAGLIWSKASDIVGAHDRGDLIRSKDGFWLAIPLPAAGKSRRGGRISPAEWESRTGRRLRFVYRPGRAGLLVDDGTVKRGARVMGRDGFSRPARGFKSRTVPIFALVPQVKLRKRLNLEAAARGLAGALPGRIVAAWSDR